MFQKMKTNRSSTRTPLLLGIGKLALTLFIGLSLLFGAAGHAGAFSVDVKNLFYSDASPRAINNYDFSSGTMVGPNADAIGIPDSFVTKFGTDAAFMFGPIPDPESSSTITLNTAGPHATVSATNGGAILQGSSSGTPPAPVNSWTYAVKLQNFIGTTDPAKEYRFEIGMAAPMAAGPQPRYRGVWNASGSLTLQAAIFDDAGEGTTLWSVNSGTITGLTPAATALELKITNSGSTVTFSYRLNDATNWTDMPQAYTIQSPIVFQSLPARFPYLYLEEKAPESPFEVSSQLWKVGGNNAYYAYPRVYDPGQALYSAVTISSTGYLADTALNFYEAANHWLLAPPGQMEVVSLGSTQPSGPVTFTFTATKKAGGTETVSLPITGYVNAFATNLLPSGNITTATPAFSWTGISGATSYAVQVSIASGNRIWDKYDIPPGTTSAVYNGPALVSGQTYNYLIVSTIATDGVNNDSFAQGSFTYTGTGSPIPVPQTATGGANLNLTNTGHPSMGFSFATGQVAAADTAPGDFMITGYDSAYGFLSPGVSILDLGIKTIDAVTEIPSSGYEAPSSITLLAGNAYAFQLANRGYGILAVKSVTPISSPLSLSMVFDYKYWSTTLSFTGSVKAFPAWPDLTGITNISGAGVQVIVNPPVTGTTTDTDGGFTVTGIPQNTSFHLMITKDGGMYVPAYSKFMNWNADITALLPFALITPDQYNDIAGLPLDDTKGLIMGRVALESNPLSFISGATITAFEWIPASETTGVEYAVTYTGGGATTAADGVYYVKNVPAGKIVKLTATKQGSTFLFPTAFVPVYPVSVSEDSFFVTAGGCSYTIAPTSASPTAAGGSATVSVTAGTDCAWTAVSNTAWLQVTSGASGTGNGPVGYTVAANTGGARTGTITIAGQTFTVNQAAAVPVITNLSATSGVYGASLTITGQNFGATQGAVKIGGFASGVQITNWTNTSITVIAARSGPVTVITGGVESSPSSQSFQVTTPYFNVNLSNSSVKVIKNKKAEFILGVTFFNSFTTTAGITLALQGGQAATLNGAATFIPALPIKRGGGIVLRIDTTTLPAGTYTANIVATSAEQNFNAGTMTLEVAAVGTTNGIRFYELGEDYVTKTYFTSKTMTKQGQFNIYCEVNDAEGNLLYDHTKMTGNPVGLTSSSPTKVLIQKDDHFGYQFYAQENGPATIQAAVGGVTAALEVTVTLPDTPQITAIVLSPQTVTNKYEETITFSATGTESIGYGTSGYLTMKDPSFNWSSDNKQVNGTFKLDLTTPPNPGFYNFYAFTGGYSTTAQKVVPLTIANDSTYATIQGALRPLSDTLDPHMLEHFTLRFYDASTGAFAFARDYSSYSHSWPNFSIGAIVPGAYKILYMPWGGAKPQWWPNANLISGAGPVTFTAGETQSDIYFFARPQPAGATVTISPVALNLATPAAATGSISVTAAADVVWAPFSGVNWITVTSGFTGAGNGTVGFAVAANTTADERTGTITIFDKTFTVTQPGTSTVLKGDINGDRKVDLADAVLALKVMAGLNPMGIRENYATSGADVNGDAKVGAAEVGYILQYAAGLRQ